MREIVVELAPFAASPPYANKTRVIIEHSSKGKSVRWFSQTFEYSKSNEQSDLSSALLYLLPGGALVGEIVACGDKFTRHELALRQKLCLAQHRHRTADESGRCLIYFVLEIHHCTN